jgi:hypothetical protein
MTSALFPTCLLARLLVGRRPALFAAAGAAAIPSLAYSSYIVEETFAYPYAALLPPSTRCSETRRGAVCSSSGAARLASSTDQLARRAR